jgi:phenylalanyl-tRNA synthetase beta chain
MKVSLNWLKQFIDFELPGHEEVVERIGAQLGAVEEVEFLGDKYKGVVVARVVECVDHPDSDHLHVCKIDDGGVVQDVERDERGLVQVVCGAPNVREGLLVAWLPPGSTVPESAGSDPFVLGARKLRGVVSNGMLASQRELALGDSHEGILEIDKDVQAGADFASVYKLDDYIIDIENKMFTHRPDCFGALGVARELAGILGRPFKSPDWYVQTPELPAQAADLPLRITNELPELVPRFTAVTMAHVQLAPSPEWLQVALAKVGQKSINNVVDLTNFYMLVTGQPLHAYDYDKVRALSGGDTAELTVRYPKPGETIRLLNGREIEPRSEAIMITSGDQLIGVGGVMGGADTEVDEHTQNIILEAASFDMYSIRRTSMAHGLFTDAVTRFNKGQSPLQTLTVLAKIVADVQKLAGAQLASELVDVSQVEGRQWVHPPVPVATSFINERLGFDLSAEDMRVLLENVECRVTIDGDQLTVTAPFWRTDIETREDVVEEVGRLYGFDKLPLELPVRSITPTPKNPLLDLKSQVRAVLARAGANEVLTYSFVHGDLLKKVGQNPDEAFQIGNALSPDLQYYRLSLTPSLLDKIHPNIKAGYDEFALFELGKGHNLKHASDDDGLPMEFEMLDLVYAATDKAARPGAAYYAAQRLLNYLAAEMGVALEYRPFTAEEDYPVAKPYDHTRSAQVFVAGTDQPLGMIGEYKASVRKNLKLPTHTAGFGIGLTQLLAVAGRANSQYAALPRFPKVTQDVTLKVAAEIRYRELADCLESALKTARPEHSLTRLELLDIYQREDDAAHKQLTFRLTIANFERTLTDKEVSRVLNTLAAAAGGAFGAERI